MTLPKYEDRYIQVDGKNIRYWVEGQGAALILVHGLACSAEFWQYNVRPLSSHYRVHALDLLGFGRSDKDIGQFSLSFGASFMAQFMDALGIEQATLVGNSLGGVISAQFAVQYPQRLDRLILVDSAGFGRELQPLLRLWYVPGLGSIVFSIYQRVFRLTRRWAFFDYATVDPEWIEGAAGILRTPGVKENTLKVARIGINLRGQREELFRELHRQLATMIAPTLIAWGSHDPIVPASHAYAAHKLIPNSRVQIMDRCGHVPQVERPQAFNRLVLDFLSDRD